MKKELKKNVKSINIFDINNDNFNNEKFDNNKLIKRKNIISFSFILILLISIIITCKTAKNNKINFLYIFLLIIEIFLTLIILIFLYLSNCNKKNIKEIIIILNNKTNKILIILILMFLMLIILKICLSFISNNNENSNTNKNLSNNIIQINNLTNNESFEYYYNKNYPKEQCNSLFSKEYILNNNLKQKILLKTSLSKSHIILRDNDGAGNCFYLSVSMGLFLTESHHYEIRQTIYKYAKENEKKFNNDGNFLNFVGNKEYNYKEYLNFMKENGNTAGDFEISLTCLVYDVNIIVYKKSKDGIFYEIYYNFCFSDDKIKKTILIYYNGYHYETMITKDIIYDFINCDVDIKKNNNNKNKYHFNIIN